jgi:hypothetical protein
MLMLIYGHNTTKTKKGNKRIMDLTQSIVEPVTLSEVLELATWDKPRSNEDLRDFVSKRSSLIGL